MPPARLVVLIGAVIAAAAITVGPVVWLAPAAGVPAGWMMVPLLLAGVVLVLRRR